VAELDEVIVGCLLDGRPFEGAWVMASLGMTSRNAFHSVYGPADDHGIVRVTGDELLQQAIRTWNAALMDYRDPQVDWTGELSFAPFGWESASRALKAYEMFRDHVAFPQGYRDQLGVLIDRLGALPEGAKLGVRVIKVVPAGVWTVTAVRRPTEVRSG